MGDVLLDLTGKRFGHWLVLKRSHNLGFQAAWLCQCDCGTIRTVQGTSLKSGKSKSCGCKKSENHFQTHGESKSRLYRIWQQMRHRTSNPKNRKYKNYGGRGIKVCDEWMNAFEPFSLWAKAQGYSDDLELDRIDNNGDYCPENCRWITHVENMENRSNTIVVTYKNETKPLTQWCEELGLRYGTVYTRIKKYGWSIDLALNTPIKRKGG